MSPAKPASKQPAAAAAPAKATWLRRLAGFPAWLRANPLRGSLMIVAVAVGSIGLTAGWTLVFRPAAAKTYLQQLAQAFAELEKGNRTQARQLAAKLLADRTVSYAEQGGAYYILGVVTLRDADDQLNSKKRQVLDLVAASYLEEARSRGLPPTREAEGVLLLGRALHDGGRYQRSVAVLREALELHGTQTGAIHALLADCYLRLQPPKLAEALEHNRQYLASAGLPPREQDAGRLLAGRILLAQKDFTAAEAAAREIGDSSPSFPEALVLQARILQATMAGAAEPQEGVTSAAAMQEQLRTLLAREGTSPEVTAQAQLLLGLFSQALGDARAAIQQFDLVRRTYYGQPAALAATVYHADLVLAENPREAAQLYKRALSQATGTDEAYDNAWLTASNFRTRLSSAIDGLAERGYFSEALELAEGLVSPFSQTVAVERQAQIQRAWAAQLEQRAAKESLPAADVTAAEGRQHRRQAGALWRKLADLRIATRHYQDDLGRAADDFRRGHGFEQAAGVYRELLAQEPQQGEPEALVGLGDALLSLGRYDEALAVLGQCREVYPKHPATYQARLLSSLALSEQRPHKLAEAQELLVDNLYRFSLAPQSTDWRDSLFALGAVFYRRAMELEGQSRLAGVDRPDAESRRAGLLLLEQSHADFAEAIHTLTEAVERYPTAPQALEARYRIAEAQRHSAKLPRKRLGGVTIETSRALLGRQKQDHLQAAIEGYNSLITRVSDQRENEHRPVEALIVRNCYFGRADALFDLEQYDEAIQAYSAATNRYQHDPESLEAYVQIASCLRRQGRLSEARGTLEQARVVLQRIRPDADFVRTTRLGRQDWMQLLDWLRTL